MEFILYILFFRADTGIAVDSNTFANEASCQAAKTAVFQEYRKILVKVPQERAQLRLLCLPVDSTEASFLDE